ncbi:FAD-dependent oxidoreductase [Sphingobacterium deserti]|uniref:FAD dependent oxidoreductase n=1 Tax=Sphingobacterium deserti TaxID=1229276 RepID=A0A0B8T6V8_9SPHI|nr:FAD-dependent oxidoreductase [Sphingobacterium deserti]KGE13979.1 hypothetical protein DI53_2173 [Sphingobacterium deserti]
MKFSLTNFIILLFTSIQFCYAQKGKKPQVLVYGTDISAYTAALQSAKSGVPTVWVADNDTLLPALSTKRVQIEQDSNLDGGIWLDVLMHMAQSNTVNDSLARYIKRDMNPRLFLNAIDAQLAKNANLTVVRNQKVQAIKANSKGWQVTLAGKQRYDLRAVIDASETQELFKLLPQNYRPKGSALSSAKHLNAGKHRTLIATGVIADTRYALTLADALSMQEDGFFSLNIGQSSDRADIRFTAARAAIGQAIGATAAYLAFFKTTPDKIDVRKLQSELMTYGMRIMPYQDIAVQDPNFFAIQRFGLAGIIPGVYENDMYLFEGDERVRYGEIQPTLNRLFSRSQLWFADHQSEFFKWEDFLSLVKFVGLRGDEVDKGVQREWKTKLKFDGDFDKTKYVTRYQFAVVLDLYASPYVKSVNQQGEFVN